MLKLLILLAVSTALAYASQQNTVSCYQAGIRYRCSRDWAYVLLVSILAVFAGTRYGYNDTWNYISFFRSAPFLGEFLKSETIRDVYANPLFYLFQSAFKSAYDNENAFIFVTSLFTQVCFLWFIKRYSTNFTFSIFLYFTLGTYCFTMAAIKQVMAMSVLMLAMPFLEKKRWIPYYLLVIVAMTIHTYALAFAVLPLFRLKPWTTFTYLFLATVMFTMMNFEGVITAFLDQADEFGKTVHDADVLNNTSLNILRVLVYAATPLVTFLFRKWLFRSSRVQHNVLVHMSIISFAFMLLGTQNGANMFARMGTYFEMGTVCTLPWMIPRTFERRSARLVTTFVVVLFLGYFFYEFMYAKNFTSGFQAYSLWEFLQRLAR